MNLHRDILKKMLEWKNSPSRLPLIIKGARQCGKSWCMKEFGRLHYKKVAYFNFENDRELANEFKKSINPDRIIPILELYSGVRILPEDTLIIFDEIQECNEALNSLKYFSENAPDYQIISAGSLLGVALSRGGSFPVGKVDFIDMFPLTFKEYLHSADLDLCEYINSMSTIEALPLRIYNKMAEHYRDYLICGGMPKAVLAMIEDKSIDNVDRELTRILESYSLDFSKHAPSSAIPRISEIWRSLPSQLAKENRKFIFKLVRTGARAREYDIALQWLQLAGLVYKIYDSNNPVIPLTAYDDVAAFKVYLFDVGILRVLSQLPASFFISENPGFREFKGAFAENSVLQNLISQYKVMPRYWTSQGRAEVDFLIQGNESVMPVEVKAASNHSGKSLSVYIQKYNPVKALTITSDNVSINERVINIPHSLTPWINKFIHF